jgi:hypothetical protein
MAILAAAVPLPKSQRIQPTQPPNLHKTAFIIAEIAAFAANFAD